MASAISSYSNGQGSLTATPYAQRTGVLNIADLLSKIRPQSNAGATGGGGVYHAGSQLQALETAPTGEAAGLQREAEREKLAQLKLQTSEMQKKHAAMSRAAPTKQLTGFNMQGTVMDDPEKLSGYERQVFLPSGAGMSGGMGPSGASLSPDMPQMAEEPDQGMQFRRAALAAALQQSNAGSQLRGLSMPNSAYGR